MTQIQRRKLICWIGVMLSVANALFLVQRAGVFRQYQETLSVIKPTEPSQFSARVQKNDNELKLIKSLKESASTGAKTATAISETVRNLLSIEIAFSILCAGGFFLLSRGPRTTD